VAALEGEVALAQGRYDEAVSSFKRGQKKAWMILGRDASTVFATTLPTRDGLARVEIARGNRKAAIEEYKRLTTVGPSQGSSAGLEPRQILELARLLDADGDVAAARVEYERFLKLWAKADAGLPELTEAKHALSSK
jgi:tetratricopeptide (TPR) repeat protein